ncbi:MAG: ABC transporter permease [Christensenellales bacterium]|jgi:simple sugar transport system permease protein
MQVIQNKKLNLGHFLSNWAAIIVIILLIIAFSTAMPHTFPTTGNITTILRSISITTVLGMGLTITLAVGGFDLSTGYSATMASYFAMSLIIWYGTNPWIACGVAIVGTIILQLGNLFLIVVCKIPDLLATCAMMFILDGLSLTYSGGGAISAGMPRPDGVASVGRVPVDFKTIGTAPTIIIIMFITVIFVHVFLGYTKFGRYIYATGSNKTAAKLSGINVKKYRVIAGLLAAVFIAFAGILVASRNQSAQINGCVSYAMPALAAVFIGRSVAGQGKPNAIGTLIGSVLVGILDNGLVMIAVPYYSLNAVKGLVLALALISAYWNTKDE